MNIFNKTKSGLTWRFIESIDELEEIKNQSHEHPVLIYKHSNRCSICSMSKNRLELYWENEFGIVPYFLDGILNRELSNAVANEFQIKHESPQVLLLRNGKCVYHASHSEINFKDIKSLLI